MEIEVKPRAVPKEVDTLLKGLAADLPPGGSGHDAVEYCQSRDCRAP